VAEMLQEKMCTAADWRKTLLYSSEVLSAVAAEVESVVDFFFFSDEMVVFWRLTNQPAE